MPQIDEMDGWGESEDRDIIKDFVLMVYGSILDMPGQTKVNDLDIKEKYKQHLRDEGYE